MISLSLHGGDVARFAHELGCDPSQITDFSANINPRGLPPSALAAIRNTTPEKLLSYPDSNVHPLRQTLADRLAVPVESVLLGSGASALIMEAVRALRPRRCLCFTPAFAEYRPACHAVGAEFIPIQLSAAAGFEIDVSECESALHRLQPDLLILNNPHNPSGRLTPRSIVRTILAIAAQVGTTVLIDEAFIDYTSDHQVTSDAAARPGMICIRSLTKFFGCPALRIGYAVAHPSLLAQVKRQMPAWPVGTIALDALAEAIRDEDYIRNTHSDNSRERSSLISSLADLGLKSYPASANFLLLKLPDAWPASSEVHARLLAEYRILVRDCSSFEGLETGGYLRVAVLDGTRNRSLVDALAAMEAYIR